MQRKSRKPFVERETYVCAKQLVESGFKQTEIAKALDISTSTINRINKTETYEEYRERNEMGWTTKKAEKKVEPEKAAETRPDPVMSGYQTNRIIDLLKEQNEMIKLISNKLAYIVCEFTGKGESDIT